MGEHTRHVTAEESFVLHAAILASSKVVPDPRDAEIARLTAESARLREALTEARDDLRRGMLVDGGKPPSSVVDALYAIDAALNDEPP